MREKLKLRLVKQLKVENNVFNEVKQHFDEPEMIELVQLIGLYTGVSMMVALVQPEMDQY